jgi:hypothetical protein
MSGMTKTGIVSLLAVVTIATVWVYWTQTPQYVLLRILQSESGQGQQRAADLIYKGDEVKKRPPIQQRTEKLVHYLALLQNETLEQTYGLTIEQEARIEWNRAVLTVKLNNKLYSVPFHQQADGRWQVVDFENRGTLLREASERKTNSPVSIIARL